MPKRTSLQSDAKGAKPYADYPLSFHKGSGQFCKKVRGKVHYFGTDAQAALDKWLAEKDYLLAGRERPTTPETTPDGLTVRELCNEFLHAKRELVETGELRPRTWSDYQTVCKRVVKVFGPGRLVDDLQPADFAKLRRDFANTHGPVALSGDVTRVRVLFNFAYENGLIDKPIRYGNRFDKPTKAVLRAVRNEKGELMFEPEQVRAMLAEASKPLKAMILLGLNGGLGNTDCALLTQSAIDGRWLNYPRPKTGVARRIPLWPETVAAIREAIAERPKPRNPEHSGRVFITAKGNTWERRSKETKNETGDDETRMDDDPITKAMGKLLQDRKSNV